MSDLPHDPTLLDPAGQDTSLGSETRAGLPDSGSESLDGSRFTPGVILAGRYRLVARIGRGGMGEVYRAEDLKLGAPVAVKLLPPKLTLDADALARFHREVRLSRRIAHRNVCRVFDIGEVDGLCFLTMEYIDGEDLSSLLRRIGRLPVRKAGELAQQLCAGLAAAHEAGVLHRDLKPANVMIDGEGRAKITDFGLAHLVDDLQESDELAGTPAYMAPEQFSGAPANQRTDVYALGLVLYEMFTGEKAFEPEDWPTLITRGGRGAPPIQPTEHVPSLDRATEDALLDLLAENPDDRPATALEVAMSLPGGDPLAAALEAGETPSPEMVAAAPDRGLLDRRFAIGGLLALLILLVAAQAVGRWSMLGLVPPNKAPVVLEDRARQVLHDVGRRAPMLDRVGAFRFADNLDPAADGSLDSMVAWRQRAERRPMLLTYWYRESPSSLLPWRVAWIAEPFDPPPGPGEALVILDAEGRLQQLRVESDTATTLEPSPTTANTWEPLFRAAALDQGSFRPAAVEGPIQTAGLPLHDRRWAWTGVGDDGEPLRLDAATLAGRIVFFSLGDGRPLVEPAAAEAPIPAGRELPLVAFFLLMGTALVLAYRHVRRGRADRQGAAVLGITVAASSFIGLIAGAHHLPTGDELYLLLEIVEATAFRGAAVVLVYLAVEPLIRRRAPEVLVTSTRLLGGRWRDPRVGRDILAGLLLGGTVTVAYGAAQSVPVLFDGQPLAIYGLAQKLAGLGGTIYWMIFSFFLAVSGSLLFCLLYAGLVAWWRRRWLAGVGLWTVITTLVGWSPISGLASLLFVVCLVRFGILATIALWLGVDWLLFFPAGATIQDWWFLQATLPSAVLLLAAAVATWTATGSANPARRRWPADTSIRSSRFGLGRSLSRRSS